MDSISGFYQHAGLYAHCPKCNSRIVISLPDLALANKAKNGYECPACGCALRIVLDLQIRDAAEHYVEPSQGGHTVTDELSADYVPPSVVCGDCGAVNRGTNGNCWQCEAEL